MAWIILSNADLWRAVYFRLLCYIISTKASQFSVLTAPFPLALAVSPDVLKLLWSLRICSESSHSGRGPCREKGEDGCRFAKNPSFLPYFKKIKLSSLLPVCLHLFSFWNSDALHLETCKHAPHRPARPPVVAVSLSSSPGNRFSSSQFEPVEMGLSGVEMELPAMHESRCWAGWIVLLCREQRHSLSNCINSRRCAKSAQLSLYIPLWPKRHISKMISERKGLHSIEGLAPF
jgi:hypothetical protein